MALRTVSVPAVWALDAATSRIYGYPVLDDVSVETRALPWTTAVDRRWTHRAKLLSGSVTGSIVFPARSLAGLRALVGIEVHADAPTDTELTFRPRIGGVNYSWDDGTEAWVVGADWTSSADLLAHAAELPFGVIRAGGLALAVKLDGTDTATPVFYGVTWLGAVHHAESSVSTRRGASQRAELSTALTAAIRSSFRFAWFEEFASTGADSYPFPGGDSSANVVGVDAVWNVSTDAELEEPLDAELVDGVVSFVEPPAEGQVLRFATQIAPTVTEGGDVDLVVDSLPAIVLRFPRELRTRRLRYLVSGAAGDDGFRPTVRGPRLESVEILVRLIADSPAAVDALREQLAGWFEPTDGSDRVGRTIELASTGHRAVVRWGDVRDDLAPAGDAWQTAVALVVEGFAVWTGGTINVPTVSDPDFDGGL